MRPWFESGGSLFIGVVRHWLGFVPAGVLGALSLAGVPLPSESVWVVLAIGACWAVLAVYHEGRLQNHLDMYEHYLLPQEPTIELKQRDFSNLLALRPVISLKNHSDRPLRYEVEAMTAILGTHGVADPRLPNRGGIVGPKDLAVIPYETIKPVKGERTIDGMIDYTITYGLANGRPTFRSQRRFSIEMHALSDGRYQVESTVQAQSDTIIRATSWAARLRSLRRRTDRRAELRASGGSGSPAAQPAGAEREVGRPEGGVV